MSCVRTIQFKCNWYLRPDRIPCLTKQNVPSFFCFQPAFFNNIFMTSYFAVCSFSKYTFGKKTVKIVTYFENMFFLTFVFADVDVDVVVLLNSSRASFLVATSTDD